MSTIKKVTKEIIEEFQMFDDWMDKYEHIIEMGKELEPLDDVHKTDKNLVRGCQSRVWLIAEINDDGIVEYRADSEALISKGIIGLLIKVMSGHKPEEIMNASLDFIDQIGLKEHLSPNRTNGLVSMVKQMKLFALTMMSQKS